MFHKFQYEACMIPKYTNTKDWHKEYLDFIAECNLNPPTMDDQSDKHHIISKCLAFSPEDKKLLEKEENKIRLRFSDHVIAHILISYMIRQFHENGSITPYQFKKIRYLYFTPTWMINKTKYKVNDMSEITDDVLKRCNEFKEEQNKITLNNMEELRKIARNGGKRPTVNTYLGNSLNHYTNPKHRSYREGFKEQLIDILNVNNIAKTWFFFGKKYKKNVEYNMNLLREMARNKESV